MPNRGWKAAPSRFMIQLEGRMSPRHRNSNDRITALIALSILGDEMKVQARLLLAVIAFASVFSTALADPPAARINPGSVTPLREDVRRVLVPPAPTGPCQAELSMDRFEVSRSGDGATYNVNVTISNIGTEPAVGSQTSAGGVLGVALEVKDLRRVQSYFAQMANINTVHPGTSQTFSGSIPAREVQAQSTEIVARIDRGPDGPRCAYDARRNNDGLGISVSTMRAWLAAGNTSYVRTAPWAR
jgi:hypothetical protein